MNALTLATKFTASDAMSPVIKNMGHNLHDFTSKANAGIAQQNKLFSALTPSLGNATKQLLSYASAGSALAAVVFTGKSITDYETAIQSLQAVTGVTDSELQGFKEQLIDTAIKTKKSATDVAGSFEVIGSAMSQYLTDPKALNQISNAGIILAKASRQELVPTLENLTSIMNQFDIQANKANETVNRLTAGEIVGSLRTSQVAEALQEFGAGAYSANINLSESVALVEALAKQMKQDKIGVGARNIITVLDSAKGLDKKARQDLRSSGVDLGYLMDKSHSLSERLHELSKISGNATKITSVFGKENRTAAQVIFNQLPTYDAYLAKIKTTNQAELQAATNSNTLAIKVAQLRDSWINYVATSDTVAVGLNRLKDGVRFVTNNIDGIVNTVVTATKVFVLWKATIVAARAATIGYSIVLGLQNVVQGASIGLLEANTIAQTTAIISKRALGVATQILTGDFAALNATIAANPIGLAITAIVGLGLALMYASNKTEELRKEYENKIKLDAVKTINTETDAVKKLVAQYMLLGRSMSEASALAIRAEKVNIGLQRQQQETKIKSIQSQLATEKDKLYLADLFNGGGTPEVGRRSELAQQLEIEQKKAKDLADRNLGISQFANSQIRAGNLKKKDLGGAFDTPKAKTPDWMKNTGADWMKSGEEKSGGYLPQNQNGGIDFLKLFERFTQPQKQQSIMIEFKNAPPGTTATTTSSDITTPKTY